MPRGNANYDVCVIGAGLVGLAVAWAIARERPGASILIVDKENGVAQHQSGHNSGVVHSGLYYKPGSLKAQLCVEGREAMYQLCETTGIAHERSGKLVIATKARELEALRELEQRGRSNGLSGIERVDRDGIREYEPHAAGLEAIHVPDSGVADFPAVAAHLARLLVDDHHADVLYGTQVTGLRHLTDGVEVETSQGSHMARLLVNCAGLHSDRVAVMAGLEPRVRIVPFRGEYYKMTDEASQLVRGLIYPVPDPRYPFLGVHFTRRIDDMVEVGPNAILAIGREHYRGASPDWGELGSLMRYGGFWRLARKNWISGVREMVYSRSKGLYARLARRLLPALDHADIVPGGAGVRAQAVDRRGNLVDDFVIQQAGNSIHVLNAPSPGATASLAIGRHIATRIEGGATFD